MVDETLLDTLKTGFVSGSPRDQARQINQLTQMLLDAQTR